jgi:hypothetical protein
MKIRKQKCRGAHLSVKTAAFLPEGKNPNDSQRESNPRSRREVVASQVFTGFTEDLTPLGLGR